MQNNKVIIFCQAPADVQYLLKICELKSDKDIYIYVIIVENIYKYLLALPIKTKAIEFIPNRQYSKNKIKSILSLFFKEKKRICTLWKKYFENIVNSDIYFFSVLEDPITAFFISKFAKTNINKIYYVDYHDAEIMRSTNKVNLSFKDKIKVRIYRYIYNTRFDFCYNHIIMFCINEYMNIVNYDSHRLKNISLKKYLYSLESKNDLKKVILFLALKNPCMDELSYKETIVNVCVKLKKQNFYIVAKGHPRMGIEPYIEQYVDELLPSYIPSEMLNTANYSLCIGCESTAIAMFAKNSDVPTFSLLKMITMNNNKRNMYIKYLDYISNGKIKYL